MAYQVRSVTVKMPINLYDQIKLIAAKKGETVSDTIRHLINRGLEERIYEENLELLAQVVHNEVANAIKSYVIFPSLDNTERTLRLVEEITDRRVNLSRKNIRRIS